MTSRFAPRTTRDERDSRVPIAEVGVPADQRGDQRQQRGEVGGEVDVHVDEHGGVRAQPRRPQRPAAAGLGQHQHLDAGQLGGDPARRPRPSPSVLAFSATVIRNG